MVEDKKLTKKELKALKRLENLELEKEQQRQSFIKKIVIATVTIIFFGFFVFLLTSAKQQNPSSQPVNIQISKNDWIRGNPNAKVTIIEFSDFQCPACRAYEPWIENLLRDYPKDVRLVYKYFPLSQHKNGIPAVQAAEAAGMQGKFWGMHDLLFAKQDDWAESDNPLDLFKQYAKSLNLDVDKFQKDYNSKGIQTKIQQDQNEGITIGLEATPTFVINGKIISNPASYDDFKALIAKELENKK